MNFLALGTVLVLEGTSSATGLKCDTAALWQVQAGHVLPGFRFPGELLEDDAMSDRKQKACFLKELILSLLGVGFKTAHGNASSS